MLVKSGRTEAAGTYDLKKAWGHLGCVRGCSPGGSEAATANIASLQLGWAAGGGGAGCGGGCAGWLLGKSRAGCAFLALLKHEGGRGVLSGVVPCGEQGAEGAKGSDGAVMLPGAFLEEGP